MTPFTKNSYPAGDMPINLGNYEELIKYWYERATKAERELKEWKTQAIEEREKRLISGG